MGFWAGKWHDPKQLLVGPTICRPGVSSAVCYRAEVTTNCGKRGEKRKYWGKVVPESERWDQRAPWCHLKASENTGELRRRARAGVSINSSKWKCPPTLLSSPRTHFHSQSIYAYTLNPSHARSRLVGKIKVTVYNWHHWLYDGAIIYLSVKQTKATFIRPQPPSAFYSFWSGVSAPHAASPQWLTGSHLCSEEFVNKPK